jgi:methylglutaconyl-CoA hydratase
MPPLLRSLDAGVLTLTLNRPEQRNALTAASVDELHDAIEGAELNVDVRVVALRGAGDDFCVGLDAEEWLASSRRPLAELEQSAARLGTLFRHLRELPKPVVGIVHGRAFGTGAGLATACDITLAAESAELGYPDIQHGVVPAMAMTLLRRLAGEKLALDLVLTGRTLSATAAVSAGLLTRVASDAALDRTTDVLLQALVGTAATILAQTKRLFYQLDALPLAERMALAAQVDALTRSIPF